MRLLYIGLFDQEIEITPVASLSNVRRSGVVVVEHAIGAQLEPCPGSIVDVSSEYLYEFFETLYPIFTLCSVVNKTFPTFVIRFLVHQIYKRKLEPMTSLCG